MTISGREHVAFVDTYLKPLFGQRVADCTSEANSINQNILSCLTPKPKREDIKFKTSSSLACNKCNEVTKILQNQKLEFPLKILYGIYFCLNQKSVAYKLMTTIV